MEIEAQLIKPFTDTKEFVLKNPLSKKLPKGFYTKNRMGRTSIEVWCDEWQVLCYTWQHIKDRSFADEVFLLRDKLFPNEK